MFRSSSTPSIRRGAVVVFSLVMLMVMLGVAALTVDVGAMYNTRADLQNAADAAALAGASMYVMPEMNKVRQSASGADFSTVNSAICSQAQLVSAKNHSFGRGETYLDTADITTGYLNLASATSLIDSGAALKDYNAVHVLVRCEAGSRNGPLTFFFASVFGKGDKNVSASAVAVFDDRFGAYNAAAPGAASVWPFTISESEYNNWLKTGSDNYGYDADHDSVSKSSNGVREVQLYPDALAPGNYGLLNIGTPNQSTPALAAQIQNGVSPSDLQKETGSAKLDFRDSSGNPHTYSVTGNPGLKSSLESAIDSREGDIVGFFLHDNVVNSGSNTVYHVTQMRFARVMYCNLNGGAKGLWVEPLTYSGPGVIINSQAPSSNGTAGQMVLAR